MPQKKNLISLIIFSIVIASIAFAFFGQSLNKQIFNISKLSILRESTQSAPKSIVKINDLEIFVDIASSSEEKALGLSGRKSLGKNEGMLFIFKNKSQPSFWMKDMFIPIDIVWIADEKIVGIEKNVPPPPSTTYHSPLTRYKPPVGIDYVLEVNAGFCEKNNFKVENNVDFSQIIEIKLE